MKIVVTGHLGFVGQYLLNDLIDAEIIGLDRKEDNDIRMCRLPEADRVYHLAAQTDARCQDVEYDASMNIEGSLRIFKKYGPKVVFASSSMVNYPVTPYAISKRACEDYARLYGVSVVRFCNLHAFGHGGGHSVIDRFANMSRLIIYGTGEQLRTYTHVHFAVEALRLAKDASFEILKGRDLTVNQIALRHPDKPVDRLPAIANDILDGRQKYVALPSVRSTPEPPKPTTVEKGGVPRC